jgi:hypothetical protein
MTTAAAVKCRMIGCPDGRYDWGPLALGSGPYSRQTAIGTVAEILRTLGPGLNRIWLYREDFAKLAEDFTDVAIMDITRKGGDMIVINGVKLVPLAEWGFGA